MILFILIAIGIALYTIFADGWLIDCIKNIEETNKKVKENIKYGRTNYDTFSFRKYDEHDYESVPKDILYWIIYNISFKYLNTKLVEKIKYSTNFVFFVILVFLSFPTGVILKLYSFLPFQEGINFFNI